MEETVDTFGCLMRKSREAVLTVEELACALYEGTPHLQNLAEKLARQHGKAGALSFYGLMDENVRSFWRGIARQLIEHSKHWLDNEGSCCVLDEEESKRLEQLRISEKP